MVLLMNPKSKNMDIMYLVLIMVIGVINIFIYDLESRHTFLQ